MRPIYYRDQRNTIGVFSASDKYLPVGTAVGVAWDHQDRQLYRLTLREGGDLPGVWAVVDREFRRADESQIQRPRLLEEKTRGRLV